MEKYQQWVCFCINSKNLDRSLGLYRLYGMGNFSKKKDLVLGVSLGGILAARARRAEVSD